MAKFNECPEQDRLIYMRDEFIRSLEEFLHDPTEIKKLLSEEKYKTVAAYLPTIKLPECNCGSCIMVDKLEGRVPPELESMIEVARKRCEERNY